MGGHSDIFLDSFCNKAILLRSASKPLECLRISCNIYYSSIELLFLLVLCESGDNSLNPIIWYCHIKILLSYKSEQLVEEINSKMESMGLLGNYFYNSF